MARLNEAPLPTESVDALKRRFVRQNRELAKNNSAQCLRIRALECEVSRLLSENLHMREEIVRLQGQLSGPRPLPTAALDSVKDQLQAKLLEFGALVSELGQIQHTRPSEHQPKHVDPSTWRPQVPAAVLSGQAPRMTGITEEVTSPRGSLQYFHHASSAASLDADSNRFDRTQATRLSDQSTGSPDLGPPPVVHFENEDPIKFDLLPSDVDQPEQQTSDEESLPAALSVNLETRRRRKDGSSKLQLRRSSLLPPDLDDDEQPQLTRTSAKRKLSVRDAEDDSDNSAAKDDFKFSRRSSIAADTKNTDLASSTSVNILENIEKPSLRPERRVLGDKNVNTSPRKTSKAAKGKDDLNKEEAPLKPSIKSTDRGKKSKNARVSVAVPEAETIIQTVEIAPPSEEALDHLAPKTPGDEVFSPTPSEPSAARDEGRDTPPPSGFKSVSSGSAALVGASRPSRRARAAVNYAEPNLVSKMRRPTAELGNAVGMHGRRTSSMSAQSEKKTMRTVIIKGDDISRSSMGGNPGAEPASPLGQKASREQEKSTEADYSTSASGRTISALMAGSKSHIANTEEKELDMAVYELQDSSPAQDDKVESKRKGSRRHSSVTEAGEHEMSNRRPNHGGEDHDELDAEEEQEVEQPVKQRKAARSARVDRTGSRRRSMMV